MTQLDVRQPIGRLAVTHPHAVRVFHRHGIDFCCGGADALEAVCARRGLDASAVLDEIRSAGRDRGAPGPLWDERPLAELVDHLVTAYHRPLDAEFPRLEALARKVNSVHGPKDARRFQDILDTTVRLREELVDHMRKEEEILFPWIRAGNGATAGGPIRVMHGEHERVGEMLVRLRGLTDGYVVPDEACATWRALWIGLRELEESLHEHMHLENNVLFPRALAE